ncbi:hypothetical protein [Nonomuraea zeae]|uniref:Nuclear transport factor 2 family protein n=1 Tax=Nonomuraea zeae TaxID=1642303 RepID=A0A5S4GB28_9ACTN|nr:hypothetical protein [Nonomuraea zeae]TMR30206.1 hypothetical protein ETD85_29910 [Nonomuraea zeae]
MPNIDAQDLATRFVAMWNEPDPGLRRKAIEDLWAEQATHVLHPPQEIREVAAGLGFASSTLEARGHDAIESRVTRSYEDFVAAGTITFRARAGAAIRLNNVVKLVWEVVTVAGEEVQGGGLDLLILGDDGRIEQDYMFPGL